ncbi:DNA ligase D [Pseudohoeflea coraliihabitans]|uniref:DNA ligase (ATP) n=1 Tax=Pseudohoeflea coraliihabitans TaxID=2860393 RepID=A0ABS6WMJ5_9HYPH|nr:DNA ligase D [Pseudohoeflea sp. DP4N28-3]MBW3096299.1 DNA ligase D [Pseudohoeflea sp. DP4N28-3]
MATSRTDIEEYNRKRDFNKTSEPRGATGKSKGRLAYLIQKHAARRLHYDFRLELDGVLKSWAVTRGPSLDPEDKRLAVRTEDHPMDYGRFEGTIPAKEYGGGTVMLWDTGWWEPLEDAGPGLAEGKLKFRLHGERLTGRWTLVRMRPREREKRENWLLIKERDDIASEEGDKLLRSEMTSIVSGRTMEEIAAGEGARGKRVWHSGKSAKENVASGAVPAGQDKKKPARKTQSRLAAPRFIAPQLAKRVESAPAGDDWVSEVKFDGYRLLCAIGKGGVLCYTRNGHDWSEKFPDIAAALSTLPCRNALIDGEAIAEGEGSSFSALQEALATGTPISYFAFDLLTLDGTDLRKQPLLERKERLKELLSGHTGGTLRYSEHVRGHSQEVFRQLCRANQEGLIAKRADAAYRSGRSGGWLKVKCTRRQEFVVGGFSASDKRGRPFASLLLGTFEDEKLIYRGRVGTGFNERSMSELAGLFAKRARKSMPFAEVPKQFARGARWLRPDLVVEVDFAEFTDHGHIRHGVYEGLRRDKKAPDVALEGPSAPGSNDGSASPAPGKKKTPQRVKAMKTETRKSAQTAPKGKTGPVVAGVRISSHDRVIFKKPGLTKLDLAEYYERVAERFLAESRHRPVSLVRCPSGDIGDCFFQKHAGQGFPDSIGEIPIQESSGKTAKYMVLDAAEDIVAAVQMGTIEFHVWGARSDRLDRPDRMVFDLDPDAGLDFERVKAAASEMRQVLEAVGLQSLAMVTGGKGIHVIVPLQRRADFAEVKSFSRDLSQRLAAAAPERYTATMSKKKRKGRIFIDWLRNERGSTAIAPWSVRARPGAPVAVPVSWQELADLDAANSFSLAEAVDRAQAPDPWQEANSWRQSVTRHMLKAVAGENGK